MHESKYVTLLFDSRFKLSKDQCLINESNIKYMSKVLYAYVVGSMMYTMVYTRPMWPTPFVPIVGAWPIVALSAELL